MEEFLELFSKEELCPAIKKLAHKFFIERIWIADGMELDSIRKDDLKHFILDEERCEQFEKQFLIFGQATHSGSAYAFYKPKNVRNSDQWPVLVLGDDGAVLVIAKNIFDLMRFWTLNSLEPYINTSDYRSFDLELNEGFELANETYKNWVKQEFDIEPLRSIRQAEEEIIQPAIDMFQHIFDPIFEI